MLSKLFASRWFKKLRKVVFYLFIIQLLYIIVLRWVNPPITITQLTNWIEGNGLKRDYIEFEAMSPNIKLAVMASEDQLFTEHSGFDFNSIKEVLNRKTKSKKRIRGASTISQQVAKNVFLWQGRSWIRKGLEVYFTFMIELIWGKERILEVYLNVIEMGKGVFGIEAASRHYFKKPANKLTRAEAARIAACLPNPKKYKVQPPSPYISRRTPQIMEQMSNIEPLEGVQILLGKKIKK